MTQKSLSENVAEQLRERIRKHDHSGELDEKAMMELHDGEVIIIDTDAYSTVLEYVQRIPAVAALFEDQTVQQVWEEGVTTVLDTPANRKLNSFLQALRSYGVIDAYEHTPQANYSQNNIERTGDEKASFRKRIVNLITGREDGHESLDSIMRHADWESYLDIVPIMEMGVSEMGLVDEGYSSDDPEYRLVNHLLAEAQGATTTRTADSLYAERETGREDQLFTGAEHSRTVQMDGISYTFEIIRTFAPVLDALRDRTISLHEPDEPFNISEDTKYLFDPNNQFVAVYQHDGEQRQLKKTLWLQGSEDGKTLSQYDEMIPLDQASRERYPADFNVGPCDYKPVVPESVERALHGFICEFGRDSGYDRFVVDKDDLMNGHPFKGQYELRDSR